VVGPGFVEAAGGWRAGGGGAVDVAYVAGEYGEALDGGVEAGCYGLGCTFAPLGRATGEHEARSESGDALVGVVSERGESDTGVGRGRVGDGAGDGDAPCACG